MPSKGLAKIFEKSRETRVKTRHAVASKKGDFCSEFHPKKDRVVLTDFSVISQRSVRPCRNKKMYNLRKASAREVFGVLPSAL